MNVGLQKIHETVEQVEELQKSLSIKRIELEEKNNAANAKLKQMVRTSMDAKLEQVVWSSIDAELRQVV